MFCNTCRSLLASVSDSERLEIHTPSLGGNISGIINKQQLPVEAESTFRIYEDTHASQDSVESWWKAACPLDRLLKILTTPRHTGCQICDMIFSNISPSVAKAIASTLQDQPDTLSLICKLSNPIRQHTEGELIRTEFAAEYWEAKRALEGPGYRGVPFKRRSPKEGAILSIWLEAKEKSFPMIQLDISVVYGTYISMCYPIPWQTGCKYLGAVYLQDPNSKAFVISDDYSNTCIHDFDTEQKNTKG